MGNAVMKQQIESAKWELKSVLRTPLIASEFSGKYPTQSGTLPEKLYKPMQQLDAVQTLEANLTSTEDILKKKKKKTSSNTGGSDRKFKGFKKKKMKQQQAQE